MDRQGSNLQNLLPLLGALTNGNNMNNNQNFINQLAAAITSAVGAAKSGPTTQGQQQTGNNNNTRMDNTNVRQRTPEPPPAPRFRTHSPAPRFRNHSPPRVQPNRGTAPMDIENEPETPVQPMNNMNSQMPMNNMNSQIPMNNMNSRMPLNNMNSQMPLNNMNSQMPVNDMNSRMPLNNMNSRMPLNNMNSQMPMNNMNSQMPLNNVNSQTPVGSAPNAGMGNNMPMPNNNMFMNGYMPSNAQQQQQQQAGRMDAPPYVFFPGQTPAGAAAIANVASTSAANAATQAVNQMFMNPTTMMAAMQQMQNNYAAGFGRTLANAGDGTVNSPNAAIVQAVAGTVKEVVKFPNVTLFPPPLHALPPTKRERPPGCRTVFIGGLPENFTEEIIREVFESCGEITILRISKKNFCHIRYELEESVERAIFYSGYRMRINSPAGNESANFGRLHVDYAQARDDLHDYECKQRQLEREQRHRDRVSTSGGGTRISRSPPPIPPYNEAEAAIVGENLRNSETFIRAIQKIAVWLERGDCKKQNANMFYSMLQSTHSHIRRLIGEKVQHQEELRKARESYRKQMLAISAQFTQIEKVFNAASHKKVWDHFTKAQRKNIDQWKKLALELRSVQIEDDEMDMSDDDHSYQGSNAKRSRYDVESLREENDSLRNQLEALRGEISHVRSTDSTSNADNRGGQIQVLQETIRNMQTQLLQTKTREEKDNKIIEKLQIKLKDARIKHLLLQTKIKEATEKRRERSSSRDSYTSDERRNSRRYSDRSDDDDDDVQLVRTNNDESNNKRTVNSVKDKNVNQKNAVMHDNNAPIIDIDDDVNIVEDQNCEVVEIADEEEEGEKEKEQEKAETTQVAAENKDNTGEKCIDEEKNEQEESTEQVMLNEGAQQADEKEAAAPNLNDENTAAQNLDDEKECFAPVETKLTEEKQEIEPTQPKFLPFVEAKIIALTAAYLLVQPFGITTESICAYLHQSMNTLDLHTTTLEEILATYTNLFKFEYDAGNDMNYDNKGTWRFCGFETFTNEYEENGKFEVNKEEIKKNEF